MRKWGRRQASMSSTCAWKRRVVCLSQDPPIWTKLPGRAASAAPKCYAVFFSAAWGSRPGSTVSPLEERPDSGPGLGFETWATPAWVRVPFFDAVNCDSSRSETHGHHRTPIQVASSGKAHHRSKTVTCRGLQSFAVPSEGSGSYNLDSPTPRSDKEGTMGDRSLGTSLSERTLEDRLDSWKEIATYLNRDVTTVQRWEKREGMPVHRHQHDRMGSV